jgi:hypothetical protein
LAVGLRIYLVGVQPQASAGYSFFLRRLEYREGDQFDQMFGVMSVPCFNCLFENPIVFASNHDGGLCCGPCAVAEFRHI